MSSTLARVTAGEGLTPLTDRANQAKETAFLCRRPQGGEDPEQIFQNCQGEAGTSLPSPPTGERHQNTPQNLPGILSLAGSTLLGANNLARGAAGCGHRVWRGLIKSQPSAGPDFGARTPLYLP